MKRITFTVIIFSFIIPFSFSQQKTERYEDGSMKGKGEYGEYIYLRQQPNTIKLAKTECKKKMGEWTYWYPTGEKMRIENYKKEKKGYNLYAIPDGVWKYYNLTEDSIKQEIYSDGRLMSVEIFMDGSISEDGKTVNIVLADTNLKKVVVNDLTKLIKEEVFRDGVLLRKEVYTGKILFYTEEVVNGELLVEDEDNLINNPGFEEYRRRPEDSRQLDMCLKYWSGASRSKPTYYNKISPTANAGIPENEFGYQEPDGGTAYAGFSTQHSEFIQNMLKEPLSEDSLYCIKLSLNKADNSESSVRDIGVYFAKEKLIFKSGEFRAPHVSFTSPNGHNDVNNWEVVCQPYKADGGENYIIIGSFEEIPISHYYVDNVSLIKIESESECSCINDLTFDAVQPADMLPGLVMRMAFTNFEGITAKLTGDSKIELDNLFYILQAEKTMKIQIDVHLDNSLSEVQAQKLSDERAKAISTYLAGRGIKADRLSHSGYGSSRPLTDNDTEEGRIRNSRIEVVVTSR